MIKKNMKNRVDTGISFIFKNIFLNNRFDYYDYYIKLAKEKGYIVTSFIDYLQNYKKTDNKVLILRHDVDSNTINTKLMFEIEKSNNVKATYYFRWCTINYDIIKKMNELGFEVGLHYETLASYCVENNINELSDDIIKTCRKELKEEIKEFKNNTNIDIKTIANHGHPKNVELGASNNILLENEKYKDYGIICEAYDKEFYKTVTTHIMDNNVMFNYGFSYKSNPIDAMNSGDKLIVFLAHPEHWRFDLKTKIKMIVKLIIGRYTTQTNREFKRIEDKGV
ncbi:TPA: hypothetical protein LA742_000504 [Clostridium botulinum]|uniref:hypothetical protein n=1 Tax=Clostridium TaxID=1485 RepID=UPI0007730433|nr:MULTISPECIES: hypothetical protein [Clostridium]AUM96878.1 hypothetical protein RSJ11_17645 [Clostridium sporogenes]AVQ54330.1 hypothetical protein C7M59_16255 [Clostridium botulinum]HBJ2612093.1 hypothetical protein [Clostridium botulinum]